MKSSATKSSNASTEQGASVTPDTEGSDHDQDEVGSEWEKNLFSHAQEDVLLVDKMEVKAEDARTHSIGIRRQQEDDPEHDGTASSLGTSDIHLDMHDECNFSEMMLRESNNLKDGEVVLDINEKNLDSVIDDDISNCCHGDIIVYTNLNNHLQGMVDVEVTVSDSQRKGFTLNRNDGSGDGSFVDIQRTYLERILSTTKTIMSQGGILRLLFEVTWKLIMLRNSTVPEGKRQLCQNQLIT